MRKIYYIIIAIILIVLIFKMSFYIAKTVEEKEIKLHREIPQDERCQILEELFNYTIKKAEENNIKIIPVTGTLLGLIREEQIIRHDYDVDIFLFDDDWIKFKNIISEDLNSKYYFRTTDHLWHHKYEILDKKTNLSVDFSRIYETSDHIKVDVFLSFTKSGVRDGKLILSDLGRKKYDKDLFLPLKETSTKYGKAYYPNETEKLLVNWYGDNWTTPDRK